MSCGWEGNRRYGVALAMRQSLKWFIHLWTHGLDREMSTPPTLSCGVWPVYLLSYSLGNTHTHTHTRLTALFPGRYQKGKINLDFTEAGDSEWQCHQLGHMDLASDR